MFGVAGVSGCIDMLGESMPLIMYRPRLCGLLPSGKPDVSYERKLRTEKLQRVQGIPATRRRLETTMTYPHPLPHHASEDGCKFRVSDCAWCRGGSAVGGSCEDSWRL